MNANSTPTALAGWIAGAIWPPGYQDMAERMGALPARQRFYAVADLSEILTPEALAILNARTRESNPKAISKLVRPRDWRNNDWAEGLIHPRTNDTTLMITCDDDGGLNLIYSLSVESTGDDLESILDLAGPDYGSTCAIGFEWLDGAWKRDTGCDLG